MAVLVKKSVSEFKPPHNYNSNRNSPIRWIFSHIFRYKRLLFPGIFLQFSNAFFRSIIPIFAGLMADSFINNELTMDRLIFISSLVLLAGVSIGITGLFFLSIMTILANRIERDGRDELYTSLIGKDQSFHDAQQIGDIMARVTQDIKQLNLMINFGFTLVLGAIVGIIVPLVLIAFLNVQLLFVPVLFVISYMFVLRDYNRKMNYITFQQRVKNSMVTSRLNEAISGMYLVRGMSQEKKEQQLFNQNIANYRDLIIQQGYREARYYPLLLLGLAIVFSLLHGLILVNDGIITLGMLIAFIALVQLLSFPTFINIFAISMLSLGVSSSSRILQLINAQTDIDENITGYKSDITGAISFENITFGYNQEKPVLRNINFKVYPGQTVAIIGMTGSGKTTLTKLLTRLYDPQEGRILIDDTDLREWSLENLRGQMALVEQDIFLFSKSIKENIKFGAQQATDDQVIEAAKLAQAHNFIQDLPDGYETEIGERGVTLSGGQRQRIAIARAIIRDPRILILDDASSAIDSKTEDEIQQAIKNVLKDRVSLLITHRIAQIRRADLIILLDKGQIIGKGNHEKLIKTCSEYRSIFDIFDDFDQHTSTTPAKETMEGF